MVFRGLIYYKIILAFVKDGMLGVGLGDLVDSEELKILRNLYECEEEGC